MKRAGIVAPSAANIAAAVEHLRQGMLVGIPTETVYGLGADASSPEAVARVFAAKGRPADHPLIVHIADVTQLVEWAEDIPDSAYTAAKAFWPGPLTMILKRGDRVISGVTGGQDSIGIRIPKHPVARQLLQEFGGGIAAPSANRFGQVSPTTATHVVEGLGEQVALVLDGGASDVGIESSIVDFTADRPRLLRPGMLGRTHIESALQMSLATETRDAPQVSGSLPGHYAPHTPAVCLPRTELLEMLGRGSDQSRCGIIALSGAPAPDLSTYEWRNLSSDPAVYAQQLYAQLHALDALQLDRILIEKPPGDPAWDAIRDRLQRATHTLPTG